MSRCLRTWGNFDPSFMSAPKNILPNLFLVIFYQILNNIFLFIEIIETVISSGLRPNTSHHRERSCEVDDATELMRRCWAEDPTERPDFAHLKGAIRRLNK